MAKLTNYTDEMLKCYLDYYSYDTPQGQTISIHYYNLDWCRDFPYSILANGGVTMMHLDKEDYSRVCVLLAEMKIIIDTHNIH